MDVSADDNVAMAPPKIILPPSILTTLKTEAETSDEEERTPSRPHLSNSQLSMLLRCGQQYKYRYVLGLKERPKVSMSLGKGGHAALEFNTKTKIRTGEDADVEEVVQKASDMMDHYLREVPESEYEKDIEPGSTKDKFLAATRIYRLRDAPSIEPLGAETEFNLDLNQFIEEDLPEPIRIVNGKIDLLASDNQTLIGSPEQIRISVTDYKYVSKKKNQSEADISTQITTYNLFVFMLTGKWPTKAGLMQIHSGTVKDGPNAIPLLRDPALMTPAAQQARTNRLISQYKEAERMIRNEIFIATDNPINCSWCGYRDRCQESRVDDFTAAKIRNEV